MVGRQVGTEHGGWIDLLAIAPDGTLVVAELKCDKTPREVVAQALDYASWIESLDLEDVAAIYSKFKPGRLCLLPNRLKPPGHMLVPLREARRMSFEKYCHLRVA